MEVCRNVECPECGYDMHVCKEFFEEWDGNGNARIVFNEKCFECDQDIKLRLSVESDIEVD